jgi:hypothetical protein
MKMMVNIEGLDKASVLAALYNAARPQGMGFLQYDPNNMEEKEARELLLKGAYFDYLKGRVMKVDLTSDVSFDATWYNRDNGYDAAQIVVDMVRRVGITEGGPIEALHELGKMEAAAHALELADTKTVTRTEGGFTSITLGADDAGELLKEKVKRAIGEEDNLKENG